MKNHILSFEEYLLEYHDIDKQEEEMMSKARLRNEERRKEEARAREREEKKQGAQIPEIPKTIDAETPAAKDANGSLKIHQYMSDTAKT